MTGERSRTEASGPRARSSGSRGACRLGRDALGLDTLRRHQRRLRALDADPGAQAAPERIDRDRRA